MAALLPTPVVNDMGAGKTVEESGTTGPTGCAESTGNGNGHGPSLAIEAQRMLPTPSAADGTGGRVNRSGDRSDEYLLPGIASHGSFGPYTAAIQRWEQVLGRPAPPPTEPGQGDRPRLSPRFVEWLMGLPDGWVTDPALGIPRAAQLKALGNGIVPQQMALALRLLLDEVAPCPVLGKKVSGSASGWRQAAWVIHDRPVTRVDERLARGEHELTKDCWC